MVTEAVFILTICKKNSNKYLKKIYDKEISVCNKIEFSYIPAGGKDITIRSVIRSSLGR